MGGGAIAELRLGLKGVAGIGAYALFTVGKYG